MSPTSKHCYSLLLLFGVVLNTDNTESLITWYGLYMALATLFGLLCIGYIFTKSGI